MIPAGPLKTARIINGRLRNLRYCLLNSIGNPVLVLLYHRVTELQNDAHAIAVSPDNFRTQMSYIKENFRLVRFDEDWSALKEPGVAVTFDDGYADNALQALPVLEELGVPATFFVSSGYLDGNREFWWDELEGLVLASANYPSIFKLLDHAHGRSWPTATLEERKAMHWDLHQMCMGLNAEQRCTWLEQLKTWSGGERRIGEDNRILSVEQLKVLADSKLVTIGAHTVTHSPLSALSAEEQRYEILTSKMQLEKILGEEITVFSYPFGKKSDYNATSIGICREAGFYRVASAFPGQSYRWTDPYQIPRHIVYDWDVDTFAMRLKCLWM